MKTTIRAKFISLSILIILPMFALMSLFLVLSVDQYNLANVKKTVLNDSYLLQIFLSQYLAENADQPLGEREYYFLNRDSSKLVGLRTQLYIAEGRFYVDSKQETTPTEEEDFINGRETRLALSGEKNYILKRSNGRRSFRMNFPIYQNLKPVGVMRIEYPLKEEDRFKTNFSIILVLINLLVCAAFIMLLSIFTQGIVSPLTQLKLMVQKFAAGKFEEQAKIKSGDEVEELADAFHKMAYNINQLIQSLKDEKNKQQEFFNNMTHEIRTPLTTIIGYADIIEKLETKEERNDCLQYIRTEGKRLLRLVADLFRSSQLNTYTITLTKTNCNLEKLLRETVEIIRYKANKYGIVINTSIRAKIRLRVDQDKLKEVLLNLIDNAILHSKSSKIHILLSAGPGEALFEVKDFGQGIDEAQMEQIHQKFSGCLVNSIYDQADHGYGLTISKKIVEAHGGSLEIESTLMKGTVVRVRLPLGEVK
jgi:two-component system sensor histidine kinase ArlS